MFTSEQIKEIAIKLQAAGKRNSQFPVTEEAFGKETFSILQDGENKQFPIESFVSYAHMRLLEDFQETLEKYLKMMDDSINNGFNEVNIRIDTLNSQTDTNIKNLISTVDEDIKEFSSTANANLKNLTSTVDRDINNFTTTVHNDINTLITTTKSTIQAVVDDVHDQITDFEETLDQNLATIRSALESLLDDINSDWNAVNTQLKSTANSLDSSSENIDQSATNIANSAQQLAQSKTDIDSAVQDINEAKTSIEEAEATFKSTFGTAVGEMEAAAEDIKTAATDLNTATTNLNNAKEQLNDSKEALDTATGKIDTSTEAITEAAQDLANTTDNLFNGTATLKVNTTPESATVYIAGREVKELSVTKGTAVGVCVNYTGYHPFYATPTIFRDSQIDVILFEDLGRNTLLILIPEELDFTYSGGTKKVEVQCTDNWNISQDPTSSWFDCSKSTSSGNGYITVTADSYSGRNDKTPSYIEVRASKSGSTEAEVRRIIVNQSGRPTYTTFTQNGGTTNLSNTVGSKSFSGVSNSPAIKIVSEDNTGFLTFTLTVNSDVDESWNKSSGTVTGDPGKTAQYNWTLGIKTSLNTSLSSRTARFKISDSAGNTSNEFVIVQAGAPATLSIEPTSKVLEYPAGNFELEITSNTTWKIT